MNYEALAQLLFPNIDKDTNYYENKYPKRDLNDNNIVTRFAPSPTGFVHMGSLYVSFLNRVFTNQSGGIFFLRIEDTDQKREVEGGIDKIYEALEYFNISVDESTRNNSLYGPYIQSERKEIYQTYVKDLVRKGLAYPCFCTEEELENIRKEQELKKIKIGYYGEYAKCKNLTLEQIKSNIDNNIPYVIRLKCHLTDEKIECSDLIKGKVIFPKNDIDIVLLKSDGIPTYHFAHAVDDHLMRTTHVIRGDEWLSSLPIHLQLFSILGFNPPKYAHISPLTKKDGDSIRKLSKRKDPECAMSYYQELGLPTESLKLYFATITNSDFEQWYNQTKGNIEDFKFVFNKMPVGGTLFDMEKLLNISRTYFSIMNAEDIYNESLKYYKEYDIDFYNILLNNKDYSIRVLNIEKNKARPRKDIACYKDVKDEISYMFSELFYNDVVYENSNYNVEILDEYINNYFNIEDTEEAWYNRIKSLAVKFNYAEDVRSYKDNPDNYKGHVGDICEMIRVVLTGRTKSPSLYEIQQVLGLEEIIKRIENYKKNIA
jgi:glutamyl-tRNA synthetase